MTITSCTVRERKYVNTKNRPLYGQLQATALKNGAAALDSYAYAYDAAGRRTQVTRVDNASVSYGYDDLGQLTGAAGWEPDGVTQRANENFSCGYDPALNLLGRTNNTLLQSFQTDKANPLVNVSEYNNVLTVAGSVPSTVTGVSVNGQGAALYHDLTFAVAGGVTVNNGLNEFTTVVTSAGVTLTNVSPEFLPASVSLRYDGNGNLVWDGLLAYSYDGANELTAVTLTNGWKTGYVYDGLGRRRIRQDYTWNQSGSAWTETNEVHYVYDGRTVIQERNAGNVPLVTYTRGVDLSGTSQGAGGIGGLLARTDGNGSAFYHTDGNGNVTALVNGGGALVAKYLYDSFGNTLGMWGSLAAANTQRFSSKEQDPRSGLYYYGYRWYDPNLQRWLSRDPIQERGGINLYGFVRNSPINWIDPLGLFGDDPYSLPPSGGSQVNGVPAITITKTPCDSKNPWNVKNNDSPKELAMMMIGGGALVVGGGGAAVLVTAGPPTAADFILGIPIGSAIGYTL